MGLFPLFSLLITSAGKMHLTIYQQILFISMIVWFLPLLKQRRTFYFGYFLVLALGDPIVFVGFNIFRLNPSILSILVSCFAIGFLQEKKRRIPLIVLWIGFTLLLFLTVTNKQIINLCVTFSIVVTLYYILIKFIEQIKQGELNVFLVLLLFYNFINFIKFLLVSIELLNGVIGFYLGLGFQILLGFAFTFVNINTKNYSIGRGVV